jgi:uncharacterized protein YjbI with pentapeptide repeats
MAIKFASSLRAKVAAIWTSALDRKIARYRSEQSSRDGESHLLTSISELSKECRLIWALHVSASLIIAICAVTVRDEAFWGHREGTGFQIPLLGTSVAPSAFFLITPIVSISLGIYLQIYLGFLHDSLRRLVLSIDGGRIAPGILYPWIGTLCGPGGGAPQVVQWTWFLLNWGLVPATIGTLWLRLAPFRSDSFEWLAASGRIAPSSVFFALFIVCFACFGLWSWIRESVDRAVMSVAETGVHSPRRRFWSAPSRFAALVFVVLLVAACVYEPLCTSLVEKYSSIPICIVDLSYIQSTEASPLHAEVTHLRGAHLDHGQLRAAHFEGAWLEYATMAYADATDASFESWAAPWLHESQRAYRDTLGWYFEGNLVPDPDETSPLLRINDNSKRLQTWGAYCKRGFEGTLRSAPPPQRPANLEFALLDNLIAKHATFADAILWHVRGSHVVAPDSSFEFADLFEAQFLDSNFEHANMRGVIAEYASFAQGQLEASDWLGACAAIASFGGADLKDARLASGHFEGAFFDDARLDGADLRGGHFEGAFFRGASLRGADLRGALLEGADLSNADLSGADIRGWQIGSLTEECLKDVQFRHVTPTEALKWQRGKSTILSLADQDTAVCADGVSDETCRDIRAVALSRTSWKQRHARLLSPAAPPTWLQWQSKH